MSANVEVNRRAEGTSELNRRLGAGGKGAAALERCGVAGEVIGAPPKITPKKQPVYIA